MTKEDVDAGRFDLEKLKLGPEGHSFVSKEQEIENSEDPGEKERGGPVMVVVVVLLVVWRTKHRWLPPLFAFKILTVLFHEVSLADGPV